MEDAAAPAASSEISMPVDFHGSLMLSTVQLLRQPMNVRIMIAHMTKRSNITCAAGCDKLRMRPPAVSHT